MNPDTTSPAYQTMLGIRQRVELQQAARRAELHAKAVARRRKAKRGGRR